MDKLLRVSTYQGEGFVNDVWNYGGLWKRTRSQTKSMSVHLTLRTLYGVSEIRCKVQALHFSLSARGPLIFRHISYS
jgi:hypothetical protein